MTELKRRKTLKALGCAVAVVVSVAILLVATSALFQPKNNQKEFGMTHEAANGVQGESGKSIDVLFIGDSEAFSSFSPLQMWEEQGFTSYVCATPQQQLPYGNTLLHRATRNQTPKVVVIETNTIYAPFTVNDAALRTAQDLFSVFEFHDRWKTLMPGDFVEKASTTWVDEMKGFQLFKDVDAADASGHMAPSDEVQAIPELNESYLKAMIGHCRSIGATPVLVSTPSTVNWNTARHNGIEAFAKKEGVDYVDLNVAPTKVDIDWRTETRDKGDHLNLAGATKVSRFIGEHLAKTYGLADHRGDAAYAAWDESLARYNERIGA